jgi:WD40 repeat protein
MRRSLLLAALAALGSGLVTAQDADKSGLKPIEVVKLDRKDPVLYEKDVEPILVNKCQVCHSGPVKEAKLDLSTYEALMKGGKRGKSIVPGKGDESLLIKLCGRTQKPLMPPKNEVPLNPQELALIKLWIDQGAKAPTGVRERPKANVSLPPPQVQPVRALAISPDKKFIVAGRANQIHLYDATSGDHVKTFIDPGLTTPDKKPVQAAHLSIVEALTFSPDGKLIVSGAYQEAFVWDTGDGSLKKKLTGFADRVVALAFSPDGKLLATGGGAPTEDGEIKVFEIETGKLALEIKSGHSDTVFGLCFSPDGKYLATCGADKFVKVWTMLGGKHQPAPGVAAIVAASPGTGPLVAPLATPMFKDAAHPNGFGVWDIEPQPGKFVKSFEGHTHHVLDVGWKSDGKLLVSAGGETPTATGPGIGVIKVWDFEKGEQVRTIGGHTRQVTRMLFIGKTNQIVTCSGDQTVRMINVDNGSNVRNFAGSVDFLYAVGVSPDGALVAAGGEEGVVRLYDGAKGGTPTKTLQPPGVEVKK